MVISTTKQWSTKGHCTGSNWPRSIGQKCTKPQVRHAVVCCAKVKGTTDWRISAKRGVYFEKLWIKCKSVRFKFETHRFHFNKAAELFSNRVSPKTHQVLLDEVLYSLHSQNIQHFFSKYLGKNVSFMYRSNSPLSTSSKTFILASVRVL